MLVSMQACSAFVSWQDEQFFLHEEDIAAAAAWLGKQTLDNPPADLRSAVSALQAQIDWPALV